MSEKWRPVPGWEGIYEISDQGRCRRLDGLSANGRKVSGRILKCAGSPYPRLNLRSSGKYLYVHRVAAEVFIGPPPFEGAIVRHLNDNPLDNRVENLAWGTYSENSRDAVANGRDYLASKTLRSRGHPLLGPNLVPSAECRSCLACSRARATKTHGTLPEGVSLQRFSDAQYQKIMAGDGAYLTVPEVLHRYEVSLKGDAA